MERRTKVTQETNKRRLSLRFPPSMLSGSARNQNRLSRNPPRVRRSKEDGCRSDVVRLTNSNRGASSLSTCLRNSLSAIPVEWTLLFRPFLD